MNSQQRQHQARLACSQLHPNLNTAAADPLSGAVVENTRATQAELPTKRVGPMGRFTATRKHASVTKAAPPSRPTVRQRTSRNHN